LSSGGSGLPEKAFLWSKQPDAAMHRKRGKEMSKEGEANTYLAIGKTLAAAGWKIIKYEDLGGGVNLTIIPVPEKKEKENAEELDFN